VHGSTIHDDIQDFIGSVDIQGRIGKGRQLCDNKKIKSINAQWRLDMLCCL
jgi:hypothetical protein